LPGNIGIGSINVEPGFHNISVCFYSYSGNELEKYWQVYYFLPIKIDDNLVYSRANFNQFGKYKYVTEVWSDSLLEDELDSQNYIELQPIADGETRIIPTPPALRKENQVKNLTIF
jgi:hypothetical protein